MVLKDAELDEIWRALGSYRGKIREHLEAAIETEATMFSMTTERMIREYRDLKADYEAEHEALAKLKEEYQKRVAEVYQWNMKYDELNRKAAEMQRQMVQRR